MELKQLEYFRKIADTGSINEAARHLHMSQPPLSYQLRQLEGELQVRLFERSSQGVVLTEAGRLLYERSGNLLNYARSAAQEVSQTGKKRTLRMGITPTTAEIMMPYFVRFVRRCPDVNFEIRDGITFDLYNDLLEGIIDVSVVRTPLRLDDVEYRVLREEPMVAASSLQMRSEGEAVTALPELAHTPLVLYRRYEKLILDAFHARELEPDVFCICDDARDALLWAKAGLATALFPQSMENLCDGLRIQPLREEELTTQILLIWKKGRVLPAAAQEFLKEADGGNM